MRKCVAPILHFNVPKECSALAHGLRVLVEALLHRLQDMLMLPAGDASLHAARAAKLERTVAACICPIAPQLLPILLVRVMVLQLFAGRTAIYILVAEIDKVLLAEATLGLNARGYRFGKRYRDAGDLVGFSLTICSLGLSAAWGGINLGRMVVLSANYTRA
jgi:hypothetical protein